MVFQDAPSEDWGEMARLSLGVLVKCSSSSCSELVAMASAKLHALLHTRQVTDVKEAAYLLYELNNTLQKAIEGNIYIIDKNMFMILFSITFLPFILY